MAWSHLGTRAGHTATCQHGTRRRCSPAALARTPRGLITGMPPQPSARHAANHGTAAAAAGSGLRVAVAAARLKPHRLVVPPIAATSQSEQTMEYTLDSLDFYAILGVMPTADPRTIRQAYLSLMRDLHPDRAATRSTSSSDGGAKDSDGGVTTSDEVLAAANELCVLINEIYEVLKDDERRAKYDALSGFAEQSLNPFVDTSFARDQLFVDELTCIGCGKCVRWAPGTFEIEESKYGRARVIDQSGNTPDEVQIAIETCPVDCIHYVTLPQLSLLESVLATMARIDVAIMQRTKRSAGNVFQEAYKAYEKRQAAINAIRAGTTRPKIDWDFWGTGSLEKEEREEAEEQEQASDPAARRIAKLAASAARAARMWRAYLKSRAALRTLTDGSSD